MSEVQVSAWHCDVCGYEWPKRSADEKAPARCPAADCRSRQWNRGGGQPAAEHGNPKLDVPARPFIGATEDHPAVVRAADGRLRGVKDQGRDHLFTKTDAVAPDQPGRGKVTIAENAGTGPIPVVTGQLRKTKVAEQPKTCPRCGKNTLKPWGPNWRYCRSCFQKTPRPQMSQAAR